MIVTLDLSAMLVHSENQDVQQNRYEYIEVAVRGNAFSKVEAKLVGEELVKPDVQ